MIKGLLIAIVLFASPLFVMAQEGHQETQAPVEQSVAAPAAPAAAEGQAANPEEHSATAEHADGAAHEGGHEAGGEYHAQGIPVSVLYQAINFAIFVGLLFYFLRKPVVSFFQNREQVYQQALIRGETARREAESKKKEIQDRLRQLEANSNQSVSDAKAEAAALLSRITAEAQELAQRLREEAKRSADLEVERAKHMLREEVLTQAIALSRKMLEDKMAEPDQKRLQTEFVEKIAGQQSEVR